MQLDKKMNCMWDFCVIQVMILGLYIVDNNQIVNFDRLVKVVVIDFKFGKYGSGKNFVIGDDKVRERERKSERKKEKIEIMREFIDRY